MANLSLTAANSVYMLAVTGLYDIPRQLQGYAADDAFSTDGSQSAEVVKGVDGKMSAGFTPFLTRQRIMLQADSESGFLFEDWIAAQTTTQSIYYANATISLPALGRKYTMTKGVIESVPIVPSAKKILQAREFTIVWDLISPSPI